MKINNNRNIKTNNKSINLVNSDYCTDTLNITKRNKLQAPSIIIISLICCLIMGVVDAYIKPQYFVKSIIKLSLFLLLPLAFFMISKDRSIKGLFKIEAKGLATALLAGLIVFTVIFGGYFLLGKFFDLSQITKSLTKNVGVDKNNFIFVAIYISFINSLLEEFFFRGFSYLTLRKLTNRRFAFIFSSSIFALYHVAMMIGWFSLPLFLLVMTALFIGGAIFNYVNEKYENIYMSWLIHMFANFAINGIGIILFNSL